MQTGASATSQPGTQAPKEATSGQASSGQTTSGQTASGPGAKAAPSGGQGAAGQSAQRTTAPARQRKGGFFALFLGGVCAAAIGFGAAYYVLPQMGIMTPAGAGGDDLAARLDAQSERIDALSAQVADQPGAPEAPDLSGIESSQQALEGTVADLSDQISALSQRLDQVEAQPAADGSGVSASQLNALQNTLSQQGEQLAALTREAEEADNAARAAAQQALRRAALTRIRTALDTGSGFAEALGDLERAGMATPDALQEVAETGAPTQAALQEAFAPAARAALSAARGTGAEAADPGFWSFMSDQLGARSLERKEGPGTDAILSRVEDDLRQGELESALNEVETLPDPAKAELSDWAADARARLQALAAHDALAAKLN
ncbi:hypothetical protein V8352_04110 [Roseovarius sp. D0-M9]